MALTTPALAQSGKNSSLDRSAPFEENYRIVGGEQVVDPKAWPWQVALFQKTASGSYRFFCGGSLIAQRWVLTAAHCLVGNARLPENLAVVERTLRLDFDMTGNPRHGGRRIAVRRAIAHENYNPDTSENDIALLELASAAFSTPAPYARRDASSHLETPGNASIVTGWGQLRETKKDPQGHTIDSLTGDPVTPANIHLFLSDSLRQVELPLVAWENCSEAYRGKSNRIIDQRTICAAVAEGGKDSCQGDSGGPLITMDERRFFIQVGVVSWGGGCARKGAPGVYTRISAYESWLRENTGIQQDAPSAELQQVVDNLLQLDNSAGLSVAYVQGARLKIGQKVHVRATARRAGYLLLIEVSSDGSVTQIYPSQLSLRSRTGALASSNRLDPGHPILVPDPAHSYSGFELEVEGPTGNGRLLAVLAEEPMKWLKIPNQPRTFENRADALGYLATLSRILNRGLAIEGRPQSAVSSTVTPFTIIQ